MGEIATIVEEEEEKPREATVIHKSSRAAACRGQPSCPHCLYALRLLLPRTLDCFLTSRSETLRPLHTHPGASGQWIVCAMDSNMANLWTTGGF